MVVVIKGKLRIEIDKAPANKLFDSPNTTKKIKYPNKPTTILGKEDNVSIQVLKKRVTRPGLAYIAKYMPANTPIGTDTSNEINTK